MINSISAHPWSSFLLFLSLTKGRLPRSWRMVLSREQRASTQVSILPYIHVPLTSCLSI